MPTFGEVVSNSLAQADAKKKAYLDADMLGRMASKVGLAHSIVTFNPIPWMLTDQVDTLLKIKDNHENDVLVKFQGYLDLAQGKFAKAQVQTIAGVSIGSDAPISSRMFQAMADMGEISAMLSGAGIFAEVVSLGQIDRCSEEIRRYLDMSGATQLVNFGYGLILERMIGDQINHEMNALMQKGVLSLTELAISQMRRPGFDPGSPAWEPEYLTEVRKYGLNDTNAERLLKVAQFYPGPQDWIRFAVRDVFNDRAVAEGQYDSSFPEVILKYSRGGGVSDEVMRWYWRAHWQLPSPTMLYEMIHRKIITVEQATEALKTDDWAPGWIPRLIAMSYTPLTRVDARRMFESGTLTPDQYVEAMEAQGYSPEHARLFLAWATSDKKASQKDLTLAQVGTAYDLGLIDDGQYRKELARIGYDDQESTVLQETRAAKKKHELTAVQVKLAVKKYKYDKVDESGLRVELDKAGLKKDAIEIEVEKAKVERTSKRKLPSKEDLISWLKKGIIDEGKFRVRMTEVGYSEEDIGYYLLESSPSGSE